MGTVAWEIIATDRPGLLRDLAAAIADIGGNISGVHLERGDAEVQVFLETEGTFEPSALHRSFGKVSNVKEVQIRESAGAIFGKRVIVIGGGAQVAQVVLGAVSEADRHNLRGERISVDTIPLTGESPLAEAVRAVARLPRAKVLVLAGSLMGGDISDAVRELSAGGIPVISLNMVGGVTEVADLVVTDPVQAGTMAVMAIADTAKFDLARVRGMRF